ncbi:uncharacterized protein IWZ02DRAFT_437339 [Phyllosticta citriasiana]|uniref:uncharacterized protein n=1 Tax=Phyllosticta citriasiana TaxID=595635 RepID=UPI0030FDED76
MAAAPNPNTTRSSRLTGFFYAVFRGQPVISSAREGQLFIDAICEKTDRKDCVERLVASQPVSDALRAGLRFDISINFINGHLERLLSYLRRSLLKQLSSGETLHRLLLLTVNPPTLWNAFVAAQKKGQLTPASEHAFAWLLLELLSWTPAPPVEILPVAEDILSRETLTKGSTHEVRVLGYRIKQVVNSRRRDVSVPECTYGGPGGRHDNDFANFREIAIYPTNDELVGKDKPYYRRADAIDDALGGQRVAMLLDNQCRLLREDMLAELRDDLKISQYKKGRHRSMRLRGIKLAGLYAGSSKWRTPFCLTKLAELKGLQRKSFLHEEKRFLKHNSFSCLMENGRVVAFANVERVEEKLLMEPPQVTLRISDPRALEAVFPKLKQNKSEVDFVVVDTAMFAYEPVLECLRRQVELPLEQEILGLGEMMSKGMDLQYTLDLPSQVNLDPSQLESLLSGLRQTVSLIQGPPGTGKSFIGALIANAFQKHTPHKILVICYTNHALDQFLEDMMKIGIPDDVMVRLGSKSSPRTEHLNLHHMKQINQARRNQSTWALIEKLRGEVQAYEDRLRKLLVSYKNASIGLDELLLFEAFQVPEEEQGFIEVGGRGEVVTYERWRRNLDPGVYKDRTVQPAIWNLGQSDRESKIQQWTKRIMEEKVTAILQAVKSYGASQSQLKKTLDEQKAEILRSKRIVACTTTGAAMHTKLLQNASPDIILVEEAGEILESHVLTAMTPATKQLILIGDHKQLRPKVNNFALTVERGDGYDLNRSLFERLILAGFTHTMLTSQHRMHPEISHPVRFLTYPNLCDAPRTSKRPSLRGLQDHVMFLNHSNLEGAEERTWDRRDEGTSVIKKNDFEADMVLQIVRCLGQQGYGTGEQVVLTPYLGQLALLRKKLGQENDPVLNDLDSFDLVKAGLIAPESAAHSRKTIKLSTIGRLTPQCAAVARKRRAHHHWQFRDFSEQQEGQRHVGPLSRLHEQKRHIYEGLPVKCEQHPDKEMILKQKTDLAEHCPDGGCEEPCGAKLRCGIHEYPQRCHQLSDHSKMECNKMMSDPCLQKHKLTWRCHNGRPATCKQCEFEIKEKELKAQRDLQLGVKRQERQRLYASQLVDLQNAIDHRRRLRCEQNEEAERQKGLQQHREDLQNLKRAGLQAPLDEQTQRPNGATTQKSSPPPEATTAPGNTTPSQQPPQGQTTGGTTQISTPPPATTPAPGNAIPSQQPPSGQTTSSAAQQPQNPPQAEHKKRRDSQQDQGRGKGEWQSTPSAAKDEWKYQKQYERASNPALDQLMDIIGLENIKKSKTTVARIYAQVPLLRRRTAREPLRRVERGCKKKLKDILNNGGSALFIDEANQLASGSSGGGKNVLDFLLVEVENLTGKVVFILAGYNKQMEAFFAHNPELLEILNYGIDKRCNGRMKVELGVSGLYGRVVARRIGRGGDRECFGNACQVENILVRIAERQAKRLRLERRAGQAPDDLLLAKEDMLGPEPADKLIGLGSVKDSVRALFESIQYNYTRELDEEPLIHFSLNKVFLGNPGTGKTTVAKLYGQILANIGFLFSGEVVVKTPADFVGSVLGGSEANTKGILAATQGKVLVMDEAYGLYGGKGNGSSDSFKTAVIDTIVAEVQSVPGDDRCMLLLGYGKQMEDMSQDVNDGVVGCGGVIAQLQGYQRTVIDMDPREQIPFAFLFRDPPAGWLTSKQAQAKPRQRAVWAKCITTWASSRRPKSRKSPPQSSSDTYRLGEGAFAKEAIDEIVDCLTKPQFAQKLVVILAGYTQDINRLMAVNPGLTSRFPETVCFESMTAEELLELLTQCLRKKKGLDLAVLDPPADDFREQLVQLFGILQDLPNWASARDVRTIAQGVYGNIMKSGKPTKQARRVSEADIVEEMEKMVTSAEEEQHKQEYKQNDYDDDAIKRERERRRLAKIEAQRRLEAEMAALRRKKEELERHCSKWAWIKQTGGYRCAGG